jgi:hypothetical protein
MGTPITSGVRRQPNDLLRLRVQHGNHRAAAELIHLEAQAALAVAHELVQPLHGALDVDGELGHRQAFAGCVRIVAGRRNRRTGCGLRGSNTRR